jgi:probable DNA metabolism protein
VRRDIHKMKALLRFRPTPDGLGGTIQLAWFEPAHHIVEAVAPWLAKRTPSPPWVIITPERSVEWDGRQLHYAPGVPRGRVPAADADDQAWLACYRGVFDGGAAATQDALAP